MSDQQNSNTVSRVINEVLPATCRQMHEFYRRAIDFILHEVQPLPTGAELKELEDTAGYEVNNWSRELVEDSDLSNLQLMFKTGPLAQSYAKNNQKRIANADELMENLEDHSFQDVLDDIANPECIFVEGAFKFKNAARDFCMPKYAKMVQVHVRGRRVNDFKVQFEPAVRICMTLPCFSDMQAAILNTAGTKYKEYVDKQVNAIEQTDPVRAIE